MSITTIWLSLDPQLLFLWTTTVQCNDAMLIQYYLANKNLLLYVLASYVA